MSTMSPDPAPESCGIRWNWPKKWHNATAVNKFNTIVYLRSHRAKYRRFYFIVLDINPSSRMSSRYKKKPLKTTENHQKKKVKNIK